MGHNLLAVYIEHGGGRVKKLCGVLLSFFVCFVLSSCTESTDSKSSLGRTGTLDFSSTSFINRDNVSDFSFGGECKGYNGSVLSYSFEKVPGEVSREGKVDCTNGVWEVSGFDGTELVDGDYKVTLTPQGGRSLSLTILKDTEAPTVSFEVPAERSKENSLTLTGTCSESGVVTYDFQDHQQSSLLVGEVSCTYQDDANKNWSVDVDISDFLDGQIAVEVVLKDLLENSSAPEERSFYRDITAPTLTLNENPINSLNQGGYSLSGTCGEEGAGVVITFAGTLLRGAPSCSQGAWEKTGINAETLMTSGSEVAVILSHEDDVGNRALVKQKVARDTLSPFIVGSIGIPAARTYANESLVFTLPYNERVVVTGNPRLVLTVGVETLYADYDSQANRGKQVIFRYVILSGKRDPDGIEISSTLDLNGGTIKDEKGNPISTTLTVPLLSGIIVHNDIPSLNSVRGLVPGIYKSGDTVTLIAIFGETVTVTGRPQLNLDIGGIAETAVYSDDGTLKKGHAFAYTAGSQENDLDGIEVTRITLNRGIIQNDAFPAKPVEELLVRSLLVTNVKVDNTLPVFTGLSNDPKVRTSKTWSWGCMDDSTPCEYRYVINTDTSHTFRGEAWGTDITTTKDTESGTYYLHIEVKDSVGNESAVQSFSAILDNTGPVQQGNIVVPTAKTYKGGETLSFQLNFDEIVEVDTTNGVPRLELSLGNSRKNAFYSGGSGSSTLVFEFTVARTDVDADGVSGGTVLELNGGVISDELGNSVLDETLAALAIEDLAGVLINGLFSTLTGVVGTGNTYATGAEVNLTATFSESVTVSASSTGSIPRLVLDVGGSGSLLYADYEGSTGASGVSHTFRYTVSAGENDGDGIQVTGIDLQGGSLLNAAGNGVIAVGAALDVAGVLVEALAPSLTGLSNDFTFKKSKTWRWGCRDDSKPCRYRYAINTSRSHSFADTETYSATTSAIQGVGTGDYYLYIQAKDSVGNESEVKSFYVPLDNTGPVQYGSILVPEDRNYSAGETLSFELSFQKDVLLDTTRGIPSLLFTLGSGTKRANYTGGSGSRTLVFKFTVIAGEDVDTDGLSGGTELELNGGTISDELGNESLNGRGNVGPLRIEDMSGVLIGGDTGTILAISVRGGAGTYTAGDHVVLTLRFNGRVQMNRSPAPHLILKVGEKISRAVLANSSSGPLLLGPTSTFTFSYTVSAGENDGDGIQVTGIDLGWNSLTHKGGRNVVFGDKTFDVSGVLVDNTPPEFTGLNNNTAVLTSETWTWGCRDLSAPCKYRHAVNTDATHSFANAESWGEGTTATQSGVTGTYYLHIQAQDKRGNESAVQHFSAVLDNTGPVQQGSLVVPTAKTYKKGETLSFELSFDEPVRVGRQETPRLLFTLGNSTKYAPYSAGSGTPTLTFKFTVAEGEEDLNGLSGGTVLELNGGSLSDELLNAVLPETLGALTIENLSALLIDGVPPILTGLGNDRLEEVSSKTWSWNCRDASYPCSFRYEVNTSLGHTFSDTDNWGDTRTLTFSVGSGTHYLHIQARDSVGNESVVRTYDAVLDNDPPAIVELGLPNSKIYLEGESMDFIVRYDDHVYVKASESEETPVLVLDINGVRRNAEYTGRTYAAQSDAETDSLGTELTFSYVVQSGDEDADGITLSSLSNGQVLGTFERAALKTFPAGLDSSGVKVNGDRPSLTGLENDAAPSAAKVWVWGCDGEFPCEYRYAVNTEATHTLAQETWGSGTIVSEASGTGTYYLHIQARDTSGLLSDPVHVSAIVDGVAPSLVGSIEVPANNTYGGGAFLNFALSYGEDVVVKEVPSLPLVIGSDTRNASYLESESTRRRLVFRYVVQASDSGNNGITWDGSIQLGSGGGISDRVANSVTITGLTVPSLAGVRVAGDSRYVLASMTAASKGKPLLTQEMRRSSINIAFLADKESDGVEVSRVLLEREEEPENSAGTPVVFGGGGFEGPFALSSVKGDTTMPSVPTLSLVTPRLNEDSIPDLWVGTVGAGEIIKLYKSNDCSGNVFVELTSAFDPQTVWAWGGLITIPDFGTSGTYSFSAKAMDLANNESLCSSSISYTVGEGVSHRAVAVGKGHTCSLSGEGEVKCWGREEALAAAIDLGTDGSGVSYTVEQIAAGESHTCVLLSNDTVKCWGRNNYGQWGPKGATTGEIDGRANIVK